MIYIIENKIVFNPEDNTLSLRNDVETQVSISNPARRILLLLIEQQGTVVQRDTLFKKVWDDYGLVSSNNNLNHCISKLRKVIHTLGHTDDVIITVPKVGFLLKKEIALLAVDTQSDLPHSGIEDEKENASIEVSEAPSTTLITESEPLVIRVEKDRCEQSTHPKKPSFTLPHITLKKIHILLIINTSIITLTIALGIFLHDKLYDPKERLLIGNVGQCALYSTMFIPASQKADFIQRALDIIDKNKIICKPGNVFIFQSETMVSLIKSGATRDFLAECALGADNNPTACLSVYVNDRKSNENR